MVTSQHFLSAIASLTTVDRPQGGEQSKCLGEVIAYSLTIANFDHSNNNFRGLRGSFNINNEDQSLFFDPFIQIFCPLRII
jgi:hypothetical protein